MLFTQRTAWRASAYVRGLLGPVQRKNNWQQAEQVGASTPHGFQRLLGRARWDADELREEVSLRGRAKRKLGSPLRTLPYGSQIRELRILTLTQNLMIIGP